VALEVGGFGLPSPVGIFALRGSTRSGRAARIALVVVASLVVAVLPPTYSILAIAAVGFMAALLTHPVWGLYGLLFAVPFESVRDLQAGGLNVTITDACSFAIAAGWLAYCASRQRLIRGRTPWLPALLIYLLVITVSVTQATDFILSIKELLKLGEMITAYLVGVTVVRTRADVRRLFIVLFLAVIAESSVGVMQAILHAGPSSFARGGFLRASGTFAQPNPFAGYLNMTLPLAVTMLAYRVFPRLPMWVVLLATGGGVLTSLSRGAQLATLTALVVMAAVALPKSRALIGAGIIAGSMVILAGSIGVVPSTVINNLAAQFGVAKLDVANPTPDNWAVTERLAHMEAGLAMFAAHPILGVGIGNYPAAYSKYQVAPVWVNPLGQAHNYYINIAAEAGVFGFLAFLLFEGSAAVISYQAFQRATEPLDRAIALGGLGVIAGVAVHSFFDDIFVHGMEVQVAIVMVTVSRVWAGFAVPEEMEQTSPW
jgi:O-antigen ligase